jgi:sugar-specific transcriptional regulator TrmB
MEKEKHELLTKLRLIKGLSKQNLSGYSLRIAIWLVLLGGELTAKQLSKLTGIPLSSTYRTLKGSKTFHSLGRPARYYLNSHLRENLNSQH